MEIRSGCKVLQSDLNLNGQKKNTIVVVTKFNMVNLYHTIQTYNNAEKRKTSENIVEKGENAGNQHFLPFPQCFLRIPKRISVFK